MTMTPYDFPVITSLGVGGDVIPFDPDMEEWEAAWIELLGVRPPLFRTTMVRYSWFEEQFWGIESETVEEVEQYARGFLMFILELVVEVPLTIPYSWVYDGQLHRRTREPFTFFRHYFDTVAAREITWHPWATIPTGIRGWYTVALGISRYRILLEGPVFRAWYLSKRVVRQSLGLPAPFIPMTSLQSMRSADSLSVDGVIQFMVGLEADVREGEGARAPAARARPRATRVAKARGREASQVRQRTDWPELPTALTCWQYTGEAYQIPIEPAAARHRYVRAHDAPLVCTTFSVFSSLSDMCSFWTLIILNAFAGTPRIYRGSAGAISLIQGHDIEEGGITRLPWHSGSIHTDSTGDNCSTSTSGASSGGREEKEIGSTRCWNPITHVFNFGGQEICPTIEEYQVLMESRRDEEILPQPRFGVSSDTTKLAQKRK
ncbi:hypothetical protein HYC85_029696 [Camellia sinensis]|uniref:Aminotransferase-like plant mobile domain-containing protein n=1 Tax=Camellia sinensis TaxID=4442 RepID=A0A7J7FZB3_CAMSI|nr:hypothetical protein HYC85_029696 [Camellia sinensis]